MGDDFPLAQPCKGCSLKAVPLPKIGAFKNPLEETCLIYAVERSDIPAIDDIAWSKPGINPAPNHLFPSIGRPVGFDDDTSRVKGTENLFPISSYPSFNIVEKALARRPSFL